mgnify:CR=1 FL=1
MSFRYQVATFKCKAFKPRDRKYLATKVSFDPWKSSVILELKKLSLIQFILEIIKWIIYEFIRPCALWTLESYTVHSCLLVTMADADPARPIQIGCCRARAWRKAHQRRCTDVAGGWRGREEAWARLTAAATTWRDGAAATSRPLFRHTTATHSISYEKGSLKR